MDRAKRQIIQLLSVLFAGLLTAVLALAFMVYSWSPSGDYLAKNVLLSPETVGQLSSAKSRLVFDHVEFQNKKVNREAYAKFYDLVSRDRSLSEVSKEVEKLFNSPDLASIVIAVRKGKEGEALPFQEVSFKGDYFRVELHEERPQDRFAYFYHPQITEQAKAIFQ